MAIKPEAEKAYFVGRQRQHDLAVGMGEAFDVTFGDERNWQHRPLRHVLTG